jgi:hypothetical protein
MFATTTALVFSVGGAFAQDDDAAPPIAAFFCCQNKEGRITAAFREML